MKCNYDPTKLLGQPIGMFHCPDCGEMIVAGIPHPEDLTEEEEKLYEEEKKG